MKDNNRIDARITEAVPYHSLRDYTEFVQHIVSDLFVVWQMAKFGEQAIICTFFLYCNSHSFMFTFNDTSWFSGRAANADPGFAVSADSVVSLGSVIVDESVITDSVISHVDCCLDPMKVLSIVPSSIFAEGSILSTKKIGSAFYTYVTYVERPHASLSDWITVNASEFHHASDTFRMLRIIRPRKAAFQRVEAIKGTQILHEFAILRI